METITKLEKIMIQAQHSISPAVLQDMRLEEVRDLATDDLIYKLKGFVLGNANVCKIKYHTTLWQEIRERVLPKFWIRKHPSRQKEVSFSVTYPTLNISVRKDKAYVNFVTNNI